MSAFKAIVALVMLAAAGPTGAPGDHVDKAVFGYYLGLPIEVSAMAPPKLGGSGPPAPSARVPDLIVYIAAPTSSDEAYHAPAVMIATPAGRRYLPPHEDTLTRFVGEADKADALGYFVVAGPKATRERVRVAIDPRVKDTRTYLSGGPLARAIKIGEQWLPLNNHLVIEYGLRAGLLSLRWFDYGGLMWAKWMDEGVDAIGQVRAPAYPVRLPPQVR